MAAKYKNCKNCGLGNESDSILRCDKCSFFFCNNCVIEKGFFFKTYHCPKCDSKSHSVIGAVQNDDENEYEQSDDYYDIPFELKNAREKLREIREEIMKKYNLTEPDLTMRRKDADVLSEYMIFNDNATSMPERINSILLVDKANPDVEIICLDLLDILGNESYPADFRILAGELIDIKKSNHSNVEFMHFRDRSSTHWKVRKYVTNRLDEAYFQNK